MNLRHCLTILPFLALGACDSGEDNASLRSLTADAMENADLSLLDAIEAAEAAYPGAVVTSAEIEFEEDGQAYYEIELYVDSVAHELELDPNSGDVIEAEIEGEPDPDEDETTAAGSVGWAALIAAAEAEVGGVAFEAETEGGDDRFEIEVLADDGIWEVELSSDGTVIEVELEDEDEWEDEEELEDDDDDDDDDGEDEDEDEEDEDEEDE
jgi:hypothetical protein